MDQGLPSIDDLLAANRAWADTSPTGGLDVRPRRRLAILTCMDSRYTAQGILGLRLGDACVGRNAGSRVTDDAIRSLLLSAHVLGTRGCVLIHHTKCGLYGATNEAIGARIREATGADASGIDFLPFSDLDESVRADLARLRECALLPRDYEMYGFVYDVDSGGLTPVHDQTPGGGRSTPL